MTAYSFISEKLCLTDAPEAKAFIFHLDSMTGFSAFLEGFTGKANLSFLLMQS
jgi:hypothetical protein